ncbi:hypothetical protein [Escherichia phage UPWr_E1]
MLPVDLMIDFESLGYPPDGAVINMAAIGFKEDPHNPPTFKELVDNSFLVKFDIPSQKGVRIFDHGVVEWWKNTASEGMRKQLITNGTEVSTKEGLARFNAFCESVGVDPVKSVMWSRGNAFDIPLLVDMIRRAHNTRETFSLEPVRFWNIRDVRTAIERTLMHRGMCECPLPMGTLDGFIAHDAIHDCARDILMLIYAQRYAMGLEDLPENPDPNSVKKQRG